MTDLVAEARKTLAMGCTLNRRESEAVLAALAEAERQAQGWEDAAAQFHRNDMHHAAQVELCARRVNGFDALVEALTEACDLLRENKQGNPARSAAHNARLVLEAALANASPKKTESNLLPPSTSNPEGK